MNYRQSQKDPLSVERRVSLLLIFISILGCCPLLLQLDVSGCKGDLHASTPSITVAVEELVSPLMITKQTKSYILKYCRCQFLNLQIVMSKLKPNIPFSSFEFDSLRSLANLAFI